MRCSTRGQASHPAACAVLWDRGVCWNHASSTSCSAHGSSTQKQGKRPQRIRPTFAAVQSAQLMNERQTDIHEKTSSTDRERKQVKEWEQEHVTEEIALKDLNCKIISNQLYILIYEYNSLTLFCKCNIFFDTIIVSCFLDVLYSDRLLLLLFFWTFLCGNTFLDIFI